PEPSFTLTMAWSCGVTRLPVAISYNSTRNTIFMPRLNTFCCTHPSDAIRPYLLGVSAATCSTYMAYGPTGCSYEAGTPAGMGIGWGAGRGRGAMGGGLAGPQKGAGPAVCP